MLKDKHKGIRVRREERGETTLSRTEIVRDMNRKTKKERKLKERQEGRRKKKKEGRR